jgi:hypothetical protein
MSNWLSEVLNNGYQQDVKFMFFAGVDWRDYALVF